MKPFSLNKNASSLQDLRVAIVHYWLLRRRGGEQVLETLADMFPNADLFALLVDNNALWEPLRSRHIQTSFLQRMPGIVRHYQKFLALCPLALESFNFDGYDLVISSESGPAKGILTGNRTCHICYCHTPMRYLWDKYFEYREHCRGTVRRRTYSLISHYMRLWDVASANRVDHFVANSQNVAARIQKTYRRSAQVIYPPVDVEQYELAQSEPENFYLVVSQLVAYKRVDLAVAACNRLGRKLVVIGAGDEFDNLKRAAGPTVTMLGWQESTVVRDYYQRCRALIFPGEEDFGMTPVEAQASGRPVIAFGYGGACETVDGSLADDYSPQTDATGIFFQEPSADSLVAALLKFEKNEKRFSPARVRAHVKHFSTERFKAEMVEFIAEKVDDFFSPLQPETSATHRSKLCITQ